MGNLGNSDRRYQVFVSSTYLDLQEARHEVIQALLELDCFPAGMELFPASNDERWELITNVIDDSDFYVVIIGGRYGSVDTEGISYTEREYDYAVEAKKPILGFLHGDPGEIAQKNTDNDPDLRKKLEAFRAKVGERMCKMWSTPADLGSVVSRSLIKAIKLSTTGGWVRADKALTPEYLEEVSDLRQKVVELEMERERIRTSVPKETEQFEQGDDIVTLEYTIQQRNNPFSVELTTAIYTGAHDFTWNNVFRAVGPLMFDDATEPALRNRLSSVVWEVVLMKLSKGLQGKSTELTVSATSFDHVKVQLVALRLIEKSDRRKGVSDRNTYWKLTPYGETYLMSLLAVRRGEQRT